MRPMGDREADCEFGIKNCCSNKNCSDLFLRALSFPSLKSSYIGQLSTDW